MADNEKSIEYGKKINTNALIDINNTSYYIQDDWFEVMRKHFNIDADDSDSINMLKTGLFGYNNEVLSNEIKNNTYHRNIIYDEHFLNTASFPESLYNFAKIHNYGIDMATPSHCRINFSVAKDDLVNNKYREEIETETGTVTNKRFTYKLVINNDFIFLLDDIPFRLPYPIIITFKETADKQDFSLTAYYDMEDSDFPFLVLSSEYIKLWQDFYDGKRYVYFGLDLFQLSYKEQEIPITSDNISDNLYYYANYTNQLAYFEVYYEYNGTKEKLELYFNNTFEPDTENKYCYYTIIDNNQIQLSFSALTGSFRPSLNSKLVVKMYTTLGSQGNFSYIGHSISVNFSNNGLFDRIPISILPITECEGGMDTPNFTQIKNGIIEKFSTRDNLITENDLEKHFNIINGTDQVYGSTIKWIKKRNDTVKRVMNAYLTLRNKERRIIPTNTAPTLMVSSSYLRENNFCIKENTPIYYDAEKDQYTLDKPGGDSLIYRFPFLLNIQTNPILIGNYFCTYVDENINMNFQYINPHIDESFSLKQINIYKDNIKSTKYTVSVELNSTYHSVAKDYMIVRCLICDASNTPYGFIDLEAIENREDNYINKFYFEGYMDVNQSLTIINNDIIIAELYNPNGAAKPSEIITNIQVSNNVKVHLGILLKSEETNFKSGLFNNMTDIKDYCTALIYESEETVEIFKNLCNYMESDVRTPTEMKQLLENQYKELYGDTSYYFIRQVPLVEEEYFENCYSSFFSIFNTYLEVAQTSINYLENLNSIDIKLTNTYGKSRFYYYSFTYDEENNIQHNYVDNIHLDINLKIYLNYYIDEQTDLAIKQYISDFVESCNDSRLLPISNLMTKLESQFDIIKYIEFFKIGENTTQKIKTTFTSLLDMTKEEIDEYVPEYMNIKKKLDLKEKMYIDIEDDNGEIIKMEDDDYNKSLSYPFNHNINITYAY